MLKSSRERLTTGVPSVIIASAIRFRYMAESIHDYSWNAAPIYLWTNIEANIGLVCACLPAMMPLIRFFREKLGSKPSRSPVPSKSHSLSKMKWPRSRTSEHVPCTDRDGVAHFSDHSAPLMRTSWVSTKSLPENEATRPFEEDWPLCRVHIRADVNVVHDHV